MRHLPNRVFYFPAWVGIELLEGRRKEYCGHTLGKKNKLDFHEKKTNPQNPPITTDVYSHGKNVRGTFWLRKSTSFFASWPVVVSFQKCGGLSFKLKNETEIARLSGNREEHLGELRVR